VRKSSIGAGVWSALRGQEAGMTREPNEEAIADALYRRMKAEERRRNRTDHNPNPCPRCGGRLKSKFFGEADWKCTECGWGWTHYGLRMERRYH
jgi:tRNA(Ile2) C34 agmatinyltransferase TiaS